MIGLLNYGLGNIQAFENIYRRLNISVRRIRNSDDFTDIDRLILPGVGAFDWAMGKLNTSGMRDEIERLVQEDGVPVLGICVGMQMMAESSEEGSESGLGWIKGRVRRFDFSSAEKTVQLPHMGWNDVSPQRESSLFNGLESAARFYFLHTFYFETQDIENQLAQTEYVRPFSSAVFNRNIFGVQFHPEKSHSWGIRLLKNFSEPSA